MSFNGQVPAPAARYFGIDGGSAATGSQHARESHPIVTAEFHPGQGWVRQSYRKRITRSWATKLRADGVTHVGLTLGSRTADFSVAELLRRAA